MPARSKFTAERQAIVLESIGNGSSYRTAAAMACVEHQTLLNWMKRGEAAAEGSRFREFYERVKAAEAGVLDLAARIVRREMVDNVKVAQWLLERRDPAFAPPGVQREAARIGPVVIQLGFANGRPMSLPSSTVEVVGEPNGSAESA